MVRTNYPKESFGKELVFTLSSSVPFKSPAIFHRWIVTAHEERISYDKINRERQWSDLVKSLTSRVKPGLHAKTILAKFSELFVGEIERDGYYENIETLQKIEICHWKRY